MTPRKRTLSVIIPVYNERQTLHQVLGLVEAVALPDDISKEIILIDDGSTDGSREILETLRQRYRVILHSGNKGKGAAVRSGFQEATGDFVIIQDADLELDPKDYCVLLEPILRGTHDIVFGNRFHRALLRNSIHARGIRLISFVSRLLNGINVQDCYVGYKLFRGDVLARIAPKLKSTGFTIEAELTARSAGFRVCEVPISYIPRPYSQGKKIRWWDGIRALGAVVYYNLIDRS